MEVWHTKEEGGGPVTYEPGEGNVILGWDHGALGMRVGEVRELLIPSPRDCELASRQSNSPVPDARFIFFGCSPPKNAYF